MVSYGWRNSAADGPRAKCDQVIYEAIAKASEIIVSSRASNAARGTSASSSRFNLQVPEISGVRSILQDYRLTLHVPIRLDVYYQHEGNRRELLERWCLEYKPASTERFLQAEGILTQDPLVQLRHVCKRIVLWLRTLHCWTRLLPSQALINASASLASRAPIGFSIYVNSEGVDDVSDLTQNQGFRWQAQPSPVVSPYGELAWQVIYSPSVENLLPKQRIQGPITASRPIPLQQTARDVHFPDSPDGLVPQSAPAPLSRQWQGKSVPNTRPHELQENHQQHTFDPSHFYHPKEDPKHSTIRSPLRRRHTSIGTSDTGASQEEPGVHHSDDSEPPERVLSGLSLALMSTTAGEEDDEEREEPKVETNGTSVVPDKRHAALHEVPPHLLESPVKSREHRTAPAATEYGYAYNNHIHWQNIHPSSNNPVLGRTLSGDDTNYNSSNRTLSCSPSVLASTPPGAAFLGGTPPTTSSLLHNRSTVTPPFQSRPMGFIQEAPSSSFLPPLQPANLSTNLEKPAPVPLASLDLLHSSPFQQQQQSQLLASSLADSALHNNSVSWTQNAAVEEDDEMPFAVDLGAGSQTAATSSLGNSSSLYASATIASFAQKCTPSNRLNLFSSREVTPPETGAVDNLASQLAEFRTFGASLQTSESGSASSSTPISLRT